MTLLPLMLSALAGICAATLPTSAFTAGRDPAVALACSPNSAMDAAACSASSATLKNRAFVFVKPHANNAEVQIMVREALLPGDGRALLVDPRQRVTRHYPLVFVVIVVLYSTCLIALIGFPYY